ncbi:hypothetical protein SERLA73DRAFT_83873 [Serpula lacrymans var. lacrymans S7.3]|uniref:Uncharacterized protein n=2 Tax=Serpula lacrymans var. lacrymans TaxID=341189 RepID=F8PJC3_SERL3|nr:uncharacterized protein SERLADRAFT_445397 [Serpula lacrymans var. lacrymans S7.9]EGO03748.1 hypothetical protein SERLA73DRAFT_83873 [Serpula lacrymans var. lacrymans S7.3]EGO29615.1 hypothetical protein SERLADRAFT_445397 [Serpula lacrymans var. lacrymans S7.9]
MSSDPSMSKPRLPKAYTDEQLLFLRNHLSEFEKRSHGSIRGDAKKFALERANEFIAHFGLPDEFEGVEEPEPRFREQIYNWYKNTVGRARRKLEGRPRSAKKAAEKAAALAAQNTISWNPNLASPTTVPYAAQTNGRNIAPSSQAAQQTAIQIQYNGYQPSGSMSTPAPSISLNVTKATLREALLTPAVDTATLSSLIQNYILSYPSTIPLTPVVQVLFDAVSSSSSSQSASRGISTNETIYSLLRRFLDACSYFPTSLIHAGVSGPLSGPRALQMAIRKSSVWVPSGSSPGVSSMTDEMERIAADRQRRKEYIQWAQIHAAALELGIFAVRGNSEVGYSVGQSFSDMMVRDAVWEQDEAEWVAGICVLRAIIRTSSTGQREEYEQLLRTYEGRWKEIKDEARQALVTDVLLGAKEDLSRLE